MPSNDKANQIVPPTTGELQALFNLPSGPETNSGQLVDPQCKTLADLEGWVRDFLADLESPQVETIDSRTGKQITGLCLEQVIAMKQRLMLSAALPAVIRALRRKLGKTQWEMSSKLGCQTLSCYVRWERGRAIPSGTAILMLLRLCPDAQTLANFGLDFSSIK